MNTTLVCSQKSLLYFPKSPPWNPMAGTILLKNTQNLKDASSSSSTWKLQANAKRGFGSIQESSISNKLASNVNKNINNNNDSDDEEIPQEVFNRIIVRILVCVGAPMAVGLALLHVFDVIKEQHMFDLPIWIPFLTTFLTFGASACGIAYGTLSASLDPNERGSFLGFAEAQQNWVEMWKEEDESNTRRRRE